MSLKVNIDLQDRDIALMCGLFECRVMTMGHIAEIYFGGKSEYAKKRLQKLKAGGLITERRRHVNKPSIHFLTRKAFSLLMTDGHLSNYPALSVRAFEKRANVKDSTLAHELEVMDVKTSFHAALAKSEKAAIERFNTWPILYEFKAPRRGHGPDVLVQPDGFIRIYEKEAGTKGLMYECFLELDRSSEDQGRLVSRAVSYREYYRSGGFAIRNGGLRTDMEKFPFRVLMVLKNPVRRNNTAERLAHNNPPILRQTWLTTLAEVTTDPLGPIWILPQGYRDVTKGTPFYNERPSRRFEFRHQPEREALVEAKIKKWSFFETPMS